MLNFQTFSINLYVASVNNEILKGTQLNKTRSNLHVAKIVRIEIKLNDIWRKCSFSTIFYEI